MGATIKPMAAIHALGDTPERWRPLRISDATLTRANYLYSLPAQKLSHCAVVVREALLHVVHELVENGTWQGVRLCESLSSPFSALRMETAAVEG
jgi:LysR family tcuABC transcriptional regulator